jgi:hypothetical protein
MWLGWMWVEVGWIAGIHTYFWWEGADAAVDDLLRWSEVYWWCFGLGHRVLGGGWLRRLLMLTIQIRGLEMVETAVGLELEMPKIFRGSKHPNMVLIVPNPQRIPD